MFLNSFVAMPFQQLVPQDNGAVRYEKFENYDGFQDRAEYEYDYWASLLFVFMYEIYTYDAPVEQSVILTLSVNIWWK